MSQSAFQPRDHNARESRLSRPRREPSLAVGYHEPGKAGRKTGIVVREQARDEDGMELLDAFFGSSPGADDRRSSPAVLSAVRQPDRTGQSSDRTRLSNRFSQPLPGRSPIPTQLGTSPRRPSTIKRLSTLNMNSTPAPGSAQSTRLDSAMSQASAATPSISRLPDTGVARKLDFRNGASRLAVSSPEKADRSSPSKRKRVNAYGESEEEEGDYDDEPSLVRGPSPAKKQQLNNHKRVADLPSTAAPFDHDLMPTMYSDEEDDIPLPQAKQPAGPQAVDTGEESVYDFPVSGDDDDDDDDEPLLAPIRAVPAKSRPAQSPPKPDRLTNHVGSHSNSSPAIDHHDDVNGDNDVSQVIDVSAEDLGPAISSQVSKAKSKPAPPAKQKRRVHPRDRKPNARVSSASFLSEQGAEQSDSGASTSKNGVVRGADSQPDSESTKSQAQSSKSKSKSKPSKPASAESSKPSKAPASKKAAPQPGPADRKPGPRNLQILQESIQSVGGTRTRSGRTVVKPIQWWCGEQVQRSYDGTIESVTRVDEVEVSGASGSRRAKGGTKTQAGKSASSKAKGKGKSSQSQSSNGDVDGADDDEEEEEEEWEREGRVLCGWVPSYGSSTPDQLEEAEIAFPRKSLVTQPATKAPYRFAKYLGLPFMGAGLVDLPPGGFKACANSGHMYMVFFVHSGRVWARVGDLPSPDEPPNQPGSGETPANRMGCEFSIGTGGIWAVPRGTKYSIVNDFSTEARLFFFQACEVPRQVMTGPMGKALAASNQTLEEPDSPPSDGSAPIPNSRSARTKAAPSKSASSETKVKQEPKTKKSASSRSQKKTQPPAEVEDSPSSDEDAPGLSEPESRPGVDPGEDSEDPPPSPPKKNSRIRAASGRGGRGKRPARGRTRR